MGIPIPILFIFHPNQEKIANQVKNLFMENDFEQVEFHEISSSSDLVQIDNHTLKCLIFLYSEEFHEDELLFKFIQSIENNSKLKRILLLPDHFKTDQNHFPPLLHTLRFQQHHLMFYETPDVFHKFIPEIKIIIATLIQTVLDQENDTIPVNDDTHFHKNIDFFFQKLWKKTVFRTGLILIPVFINGIVIFVSLLPQVLSALANNENLRNIVSPPTLTSLWIEDNLSEVDLHNNWVIIHRFRGTNSMNTDSTLASLSSEKPIVEDNYQIKTKQSWPMDQLQAFQYSYRISGLESPLADATLTAQIVNAENPSLSVLCVAEPHDLDGFIKCSINGIDNKLFLANDIPFTLDEWHTLTMAFIPTRYSFQFFLDGDFYGEVDVPSVEYWRERDFHVILESNVTNLNSTSFSINFDKLVLSNQQR